MTSVAVVTIAGGRRTHLANQAASLLHQGRPPDRYVVVDLGGPDPRHAVPNELDPVVVDMGSPRRDLPLAAARNAGVDATEENVVILLDVDCVAAPSLVREYHRLAERSDHVHVGPVGYLPPGDIAGHAFDALEPRATFQPGRPMPGAGERPIDDLGMFWSLSFALRRSTWDRIGGFDERYVGYGGEDTDFARRADRVGASIIQNGTARALHQFHAVSRPPIEHLASIARNARLFHSTWGQWPMGGWLREFAERGLIEWHPEADELVVVGSPST